MFTKFSMYPIRWHRGSKDSNPNQTYSSGRVTVTLSLFNFSTWVLAQIVENREVCLVNYFQVLGIIFRKIMTKTDLP